MLMTAVMIIAAMVSMGPWQDGTDSDAAVTQSGSFGDGLTYTLDSEGTLTISGNGSMTDFGEGGTPWHSYRSSIKAVVLMNGVTTVGSNAFYSCENLTSVEIPNSVTSIRTHAFYLCSNIQDISFGTGLSNVAGDAFSIIFIDENGDLVYYIGWICETKKLKGSTFRYAEDPGVVIKAGTCVVYFNPNGGDWTGDRAVTCLEGDTITITTISPTKESCTFKWWASGDETYRPGATITVTSNMDLTAVWEEVEPEFFIVTFDLDGGSWSLADPYSVRCESGSVIKTSDVGSPTRESYSLGGWCCNGTTYSPDALITVTSNMTFEAVWDEISNSFIPMPDDRADSEIPVIVDRTADGNRDSSASVAVVASACVIAILAILVLAFGSRFKSE